MREHQRLLVMLITREVNAYPGVVRNHWRRTRFEAARSYRRLWPNLPSQFLQRELSDGEVMYLRRWFTAQRNVDAQ